MAKKKEKKEKKAGKRMSKKELAALLIDFFHAKPSETLSMKYIFSELHLTTHPQKMLCADLLHDLSDDDYISEIEKGKFRLNNHGTEMIGTFQRKSNGKNSFIPEGGGDPIFVAERNSAHAMNNDKVKITFYAKRKNKDAEGEVIEILERANDTFVGTLEVAKSYAFSFSCLYDIRKDSSGIWLRMYCSSFAKRSRSICDFRSESPASCK